MNVIDSSGWLEYFTNGANAAFFAPAIANTDELVVPTVSLFEVFKRVLAGGSRDDALEAAALMEEGRVVDLDDNLALQAAELSLALKLPLADSIILATAQEYNAILWTQDAHFNGLDAVNYIEKRP
jgi:predicted nucleic acid-binding protein